LQEENYSTSHFKFLLTKKLIQRIGIPKYPGGFTMKRIFAILVLTLGLAGCVAPKFDTQEYQLLAQVKVNAIELQAHCDAITVPEIHIQLTYPLELAAEQTRYRGNAIDVSRADDVMVKMAHGFEAQAAGHPSATYCKEKLKNIHDGVDRLMSAYAGLE
jgi:hypothetical protein